MSNTESAPPKLSDAEFATSVLTRISDDVAMMLDRTFPVGAIETKRANSRPAGHGSIHISFKVAFRCKADSRSLYGALLVPLADAMTLAGHLMMATDETIVANRDLSEPDEAIKDVMMELSNLVAAGIDGTLRASHDGEWSARSLGCQGVAEGVRPCFPYTEGDELICAEMESQVAEFDPFKLVLILPDLG